MTQKYEYQHLGSEGAILETGYHSLFPFPFSYDHPRGNKLASPTFGAFFVFFLILVQS